MAAASGDAPARYDPIADFYETFAPDSYDYPPTPSMLALVGDVRGLHMLDIACGHGRLTRELARRGATVVGADISAALIEKAQAREAADNLGIRYIHANVAAPEALAGESFDAITCNFALSDIDDLNVAIANVAGAIKPGGFFAFSILHPCFPGWESRSARPSWSPERGYYQEGWWVGEGPAGGLRPIVGANHRMLSTYLNTLARNGLLVEESAEPEPPADWLAEPPVGGPVPLYLAMRCRKMG